MQAATFDDEAASKWVVDQVDRLRPQFENRPDARREAARLIGIAPGTVANIERKRLKDLARIRDIIQQHKIKWLRAEMNRLDNELRIALSGCTRASETDLRKAKSALEEAKSLLASQRPGDTDPSPEARYDDPSNAKPDRRAAAMGPVAPRHGD